MSLNVPPIGRDVLNEPKSLIKWQNLLLFLALPLKLTRMRSAGSQNESPVMFVIPVPRSLLAKEELAAGESRRTTTRGLRPSRLGSTAFGLRLYGVKSRTDSRFPLLPFHSPRSTFHSTLSTLTLHTTRSTFHSPRPPCFFLAPCRLYRNTHHSF